MERSSDDRPARSLAMRVVAIVVVFCLLYVFSLGPVTAAIMWIGPARCHSFATYAYKFYTPLVYLHDHTALREPLNQYELWWARMGERLHGP